MGREPFLKVLAREVLGPEIAEKIWSRIEILGDIALIRKPLDFDDVEALRRLGEELLKRLPYVKSVWLAISPVRGMERVRQYLHLAGEKKSETIYREHGCSFVLDITKVYVSPVLGYDHIRTARMVRDGERILNMFAGIGGYSIVISKHAKPSYVLSIDLNPYAVKYLKTNVELNRVEHLNDVVLGEAISVTSSMPREFHRVLMPLPELWREALRAALKAVKMGGYIHPHIFVEANRRKEAFEKASQIVGEELRSLGAMHRIVGGHVIRSVGPRKYHVVLDIVIENLRKELC